MNRLIRIILYITAACVGIGSAALILSLALGGGSLNFYKEAGFLEANKIVRGIVSEVRDRIWEHRHSGNTASAAEYSDDYGVDPDDYEFDSYDDDYDDDDYDDDYDDDDYDDDYEGDELVLEKSASGVKNLDIDLHHGYLQIYESDDGLIRVSMSGPTRDISATCENEELVIHDGRQGGKSREDAYVFLQIPEGMQFQNVNIQAGAGVLDANCPFLADKLVLSADAGTFHIEEAESAILTASVGAGTIELDEGVFGKVKLDCGVGSVEMDARISQDSEISCGMGAVYLDLEDGADSVNYVLSCGMGNIEIGDNSYTALSKEQRVENGASATFTLTCGMGQICIDS